MHLMAGCFHAFLPFFHPTNNYDVMTRINPNVFGRVVPPPKAMKPSSMATGCPHGHDHRCWGGEARGAVETHFQESLPNSTGRFSVETHRLRGRRSKCQRGVLFLIEIPVFRCWHSKFSGAITILLFHCELAIIQFCTLTCPWTSRLHHWLSIEI